MYVRLPQKDPWVNDMREVFGRKRENRPYKLPSAYIMSIADLIWKTNPSRDIIYNALKDMSAVIYEKGYFRKHEDFVRFRNKQEQHFNEAFKQFQTDVDDLIHSNNEQTK